MIKILEWFIFILCVIMIFMLIDIKIRMTRSLEKLKDIKQTLDYIDTRMDSLEFFKVPENVK